MPFDTLMLFTALAAGIAVARLRACLFVIAGNQLLTLRALDNIASYGPPASQSFLPASVFGAPALEVARILFTLATAVLLLFALLPARRREPAPVESLPPVPRWLLLLVGVYFVALALSSKTIFSSEYTDPRRQNFAFTLGGGVQVLLSSLVLYELYRRVRLGWMRPMLAYVLLIALFAATDFLKGATGLATGYAVAGAFLLVGVEPRPRRRFLLLCGLLAALVATSALVRGVRASLHERGAAAVSSFADALVEWEEHKGRTGEGVERSTNGTQYAAHVLECISLYEAGLSREWRSIWAPLDYTLKPAFLLEPLGLVRVREAAWELGDYYVHGGGIYVLGELYWNGGYLCAAIVWLALVGFAWLCDVRFGRSLVWLMMFCQFAPGLLQGMGYGFAQISRGVFNAFIALGLLFALRLLHRPRARLAAGT